MHDRSPNEPQAKGLATVDVFGLPFALATYETACQELLRLAQRPQTGAVAFCPTHLVAEARLRDEFRQVLATFDLRLPDGMPVVWLINALGGRLADRVYGPYLMRTWMQTAPASCRHFLFGGSPECLQELEAALRTMRPGIEIVGTLSPPYRAWSEEDETGFARAITAVDPDYIWVALGGLKQERWIVRNRHRYARGVFLAVGDAFELLAGRRPFAPAWMQRLGLTWVYRLVQEPRRLWKRYLIYNSVFAFYAGLEVVAALVTGRRKRTRERLSKRH
jgi:N-acetylglucosaminyldiphosphoundecaprenol N-acetyl-beta-D-mannosaminyltransferase